MMVAAHYGDLRAAIRAGLHSAFVPRPGERGEGSDLETEPQPDFDINSRGTVSCHASSWATTSPTHPLTMRE